MKASYKLDNSNRLTIQKNNKLLCPDGEFTLSKNNQLSYWLNEPSPWRREHRLPNRIVFRGNWKLTTNHDLELVLDKGSRQDQEERLILKGRIISADKDGLVFEVITHDRHGSTHIRILELSGFWQADEYNRIAFVVKKNIPEGLLVFEGTWQVNKNQQITYKYEKTDLKTKTKIRHAIIFKGYWQIDSSKRLTYIFSRDSRSRFDFQAHLESPSLYPQEGRIKYRIGVGLRRPITKKHKIMTLYGTWKVNRDAGLIFEMDYGQGEIQNIEFGAKVSLNKKDEITFSLTNKRREPLGISVCFTHKFLKKLDAQFFLRLKAAAEKACLEAGLRIPF